MKWLKNYDSHRAIIFKHKHKVAPWLLRPNDKSFGRWSLRTIIKGLQGKYENNLYKMGYYRKKKKKFCFFNDSYLGVPLEQHLIKRRKSFNVFGSDTVNFYNKKFQKENAKYFSLPLTNRCFFDNLTPYGIRTMRQNFDYGDEDFISYCSKNNIKIFNDNDDNYSYNADPGWETARQDILGFTKVIEHQITREDILKAITLIGNMDVPLFKEKPSISHIKSEYVNDKSYSGLITSTLAGSTKRESLSFSISVAEQLFRTVGSRYVPDTTLKTVAGVRPRIVSSSHFYDEIRSRSAIQEEAPVSQLKQIYFRRITEWLKKENEKWQSYIGIGGVLLGSSRDEFYKRFYGKDGHYIVTSDASRHDQNVCEELLLGAFALLRSFFPRCGIIDKHFFFFASGHIHKRIIMKDGFVYRICGGIQTGDPATSLINSFVMLLEKIILYEKMGIKQPVDRCYYGDDQIELFDYDVNFGENFSETSKKITGITQKDIIKKKSDGEFSWNFSKEPSFLQIYFNKGTPLREYWRILEKLMFIDRKVRDDPVTKVDAVMSIAFTSIGNFEVIKIVANYASFLQNKYNLIRTNTVKELFMKICKVNIGNTDISTLQSARGEVAYTRKKRYTIQPYEYVSNLTLNLTNPKSYANMILGNTYFKERNKVVKQMYKVNLQFSRKKRSLLEYFLHHV